MVFLCFHFGNIGIFCDDGIDNRPHMFTEPESRERALLVWEEFAKRYHDRWIIGGYDLLNEPLSGPDCRKLLPELAKFYDDVIPRIRKYDKNHMLTLEGSVFSMDMDIFDHEYDPECHGHALENKRLTSYCCAVMISCLVSHIESLNCWISI